jgi:hypothetical protein
LGGARLDRLGQLAGDEQDGLGHEASSRGLWAQEARARVKLAARTAADHRRGLGHELYWGCLRLLLTE